MLDQRGGLNVAELVFYLIALPVAIFVGLKHGFQRSSGWMFLILLAVIRIVGSAMVIAVENQTDPSITLVTVAFTLSSIGLSPLILCTLGILKRLDAEMARKIIPPRVFWLIGVIPIIGLILAIVGGVKLSDSSPSDQSDGLTFLQVSSILFVVSVGLEAVLTILTGARLGQILSIYRGLFYAVVFSLPFLFVRCIYSVIAAYNYTNHTSPFNSRTGSIYVQAFMSVLEEFLVVLAYLTAGVYIPKPAATSHADPAADKLAHSDQEHENGFSSRHGHPRHQRYLRRQGYLHRAGYARRGGDPPQQQQTRNVAM